MSHGEKIINITGPTWAKRKRESFVKPLEKAARLMALHLLAESGELDLSNKSDLARRLGIGRHTLDRDLATLEKATELAEEYRKLLQ